MFRRLPDLARASPQVTLTFEGAPLVAHAGDSLACALLAAGVLDCRTTPVSGAARAPYCLMGVCFDCLVTIDAKANRQACMVPVEGGMRVSRQTGKHDATRRGVST